MKIKVQEMIHGSSRKSQFGTFGNDCEKSLRGNAEIIVNEACPVQ